MVIRNSGVLVGLMVCGLVACERRDVPSERTTPTDPEARPMAPAEPMNPTVRTDEPSTNRVGAVKGKNSAAIEAITDARCAREQRCDNIGPDEKYSTLAACVADTRRDWQEDLDEYECSGGIVEKELDECLTEIKNEDCANPFDTLGRAMACRASDICKDLP